MKARKFRRFFVILAIGNLIAVFAPAWAEEPEGMLVPWHPTVIQANSKGARLPVVRVSGTKAQVEINGKMVKVDADTHFFSKRAKAFALGKIEISNQMIAFQGSQPVSLEGVKIGTATLRGYDYSATLLPTMSHRDCYVVLVLFDEGFLTDVAAQPYSVYFFKKIGDLEAGRKKNIEIDLGWHGSSNSCFAMVFSAGAEIRSNHDVIASYFFRKEELYAHRKMIARYLADNTQGDQALVPYLEISPLLPTDTDFKTLPMTVHITLNVTEDGTVESLSLAEPLPDKVRGEVKRALQGWLFLPRIKQGHPIKAKVEIPLVLGKEG